MNSYLVRRLQFALGGCLTALVAAVFAVWFFELLIPARDINLVVNAKGPLPAPTQSPAIDPSPTPLPPTPQLLLSDKFLALGNFPQAPQDEYAQGGYLLSPTANAGFLAVPLQTYSDTAPSELSLDAEAAPLSSSGPVDYGLFFWHSTYRGKADRFISFTINQEGVFKLQGLVPFTTTTGDGFSYRWVDLVPPSRSVAITTTGLPNRLRVDVHPNQIFAFINGTLVIHLEDPTIDTYRARSDYDGKVGLLAIPSGTAAAQVKFSSFSLYVNSKK